MSKLDNIIADNEKFFLNAISEVQKNLLSEIKKLLGSNLVLTKGIIDNAPEALQENLLMLNSIDQALIDSGYYNAIEDSVIKMRNILKYNLELYGKKYEVLGKFDDRALDGFLNSKFQYLDDIGKDAISAVKKSLISSMTVGMTLEQAVSEISKQLDVKLGQYSQTYYNTALNEYMQQTNNFIAKEVDFGSDKDDIWRYVGAPLQSNSHPECIWAFNVHGELFTNDEKEAFMRGEAYPGQPSPPRWNCQHVFEPSDKNFDDYEKQNKR